MRLKMQKDNTILITSDDGEKLTWDVSIYDRTRLGDVDNVFKEINQYLQTREKDERLRIFDLYKEIYDTMEQIHDPNKLAQRLKNHVAKLYTMVPYSSVQYWYNLRGRVVMPDNLKEECGPDDPPDRTYLRRDYQELVVLTIATRLMVPIWGEYIRRVKDQVGGKYKEYIAMRLLGKAKGIMNSESMQKLYRYVEKSIPPDHKAVSAIIGGIGSEEMPDYFLALVVVRRLAVTDVHASQDRGNIISNIYGFLTGALKDIDRRFGGGVTEKHRDDDPIDDDTVSLVETYKVKQAVPAGEIALLDQYSKNFLGMAKAIEPSISDKLVRECVRTSLKTQHLEVQKFQEVLCQWLVSVPSSPMGITYLNKEPLLRVMGVTQAVLWEWGFYELAALVTADVVALPADTMIAAETRMRIPNHLVDRLVELYGRTHPDSPKGNERKHNVGCKAVRTFAKEISGRVYSLNCPEDLKANCPNVDARNRMPAPNDLAETVANLVIKLAEEQCELQNS